MVALSLSPSSSLSSLLSAPFARRIVSSSPAPGIASNPRLASAKLRSLCASGDCGRGRISVAILAVFIAAYLLHLKLTHQGSITDTPFIMAQPLPAGKSLQHYQDALVGKLYVPHGKRPPQDKAYVLHEYLPPHTRVLGPDSFATMDFNPERLNVHLDLEGFVQRVTFG